MNIIETNITNVDYLLTISYIVLSPKAVKAAHVMMAVSVFRNLYEDGLLTEDEYYEFALEGENRWRRILNGDSMHTSRVESELV